MHEQIEALTRQIATEPQNGALLLKRAELHRLHQEWNEANADYDHAAALGVEPSAVDYARAQMLLDSGKFAEAKETIARFLAAHPDHAGALLIRARAESKLEEREAAAKDFTAVIAQSPQPEPDLYLERAAEIAKSTPERADDAIKSLDEGIARLGPLVTLELAALDLELQLKRYDGALSRIEILSRQSPRKESWLNRRGEILAQAGRPDAAREAFQQALEAIEALPLRLRSTAATMALEARVRQSLAGLPAQDSAR